MVHCHSSVSLVLFDFANTPGTDDVASVQFNHLLKSYGKDVYGVGLAVCGKTKTNTSVGFITMHIFLQIMFFMIIH